MNSAETSDYVGRSVPRREDDYLLRGLGQFLDDLPEPRNTLHLAFVLSPHAHARIVSIDASEAQSVDGVVAVITGAELAKLTRPMELRNDNRWLYKQPAVCHRHRQGSLRGRARGRGARR